MYISQVPESGSTVHFVPSEIVLSSGGVFECSISANALAADLSLVVDIYDLDNPVHPEGHLGWWRFPVNRLYRGVHGVFTMEGGTLRCTLDGHEATDYWLYDRKVSFDRLVVNAVLRENITNAIVYLDKVPAFRKVNDIATFRAGFDRDWSTPRYSAPNFVFPPRSTVRIVSRNIFLRDAVGNLCLDLFRMLRQNGVRAEMYAESFDLPLNDIVKRVEHIAADASPDDCLFLFFSTHEPKLEQLFRQKFARRIVYFHGVTKPELLQVFDPELSMILSKAYAQLPLLQEFDVIAANSRASARTLVSKFDEDSRWKAENIRVVPPNLLPRSAGRPQQTHAVEHNTRLLYVGRIKSHKKIDDLLELFAAYLRLDHDSELWIVGGGADKAYWDYLKWIEKSKLQLPEGRVHWIGSLTNAELAERYAAASVYVSMSEDEGFCLPVFEAMRAGVPVFAYGVPAVLEVLQGSGVYFRHKDYQYLAEALHSLLTDTIRLEAIIERQIERTDELAAEMSGQGLFRLLESIVSATAD